MKKVLSLVIAITLVMCSTISAFAVENENKISPNVENEIKQSVIEYRELTDEYNCEDVDIKYMHTLSDESILFNYTIGNSVSITAIVEYIIGKYSYQLTPKHVEHIYKNGKVYSLKEAYYNKIISNEVIDEIAKELKMKKISNVNLYPDPELKNYYDWGFSSDIEIAFNKYYGLPSYNNPEFLIADVLSNGNMLIYYTSEDITLSDEVKEIKIGNYIYKTSDADMAYLCVKEKDEDGYGDYRLYKLNEAYEKGVIEDKILDEATKSINIKTVKQYELEQEIKQSVIENSKLSSKVELDDVYFDYLYALCDGSYLFDYSIKNTAEVLPMYTLIIGKYRYVVTASRVPSIYKNNKMYGVKEAYYNNVISDDEIDEIAGILNMKKISNVNLYPDPELSSHSDPSYSGVGVAFIDYYGLQSYERPEFLIADVLSNGNMLVYYTSEDITLSDEVKEIKIGNYIYKTSDADMAYLCVLEKDEDGFGFYKLYKLNEAYEKGVIDDKILDESAKVLNLDTVEQPVTEPTTQPETKPLNTQNGAIPTGQSNTFLALSMLLIIIATSSIFTLKVKR